MSKLSYILRTISLSVLFAGSLGVVFSAITLVKAAMAERGITAAQAAASNAPLFFGYTPIVLGFAIVLTVAVVIEIVQKQSHSKATKIRWATSLLSVVATFILAGAIIPPMKKLVPTIATDEQAHEQFTKLHHASRGVFGAIMLFALASLLIPAFEGDDRKQSA